MPPFKRGHIERISARSGKIEEFDQLAKKALGDRKLRHDEWKAWKAKPAPATGVRLLTKSRINSPVPTESIFVTAYDRAGQIKHLPQIWWSLLTYPKDMEVRRYVSKAEVARCSFKDKAIKEVEVYLNPFVSCLWRADTL